MANAIKFTDVGTIAIRVTADGGSFLVSVSDTGPSIPEDQRERIFEEFQQVDAPASRNKGTGLALAVTKRIVELRGGRIWVESVVGKGSTFFLSLRWVVVHSNSNKWSFHVGPAAAERSREGPVLGKANDRNGSTASRQNFSAASSATSALTIC